MRLKIFLIALLLSLAFQAGGYCVEQTKEGLVKEYHRPGVLKSETIYKNGKKDGIEKLYDESGRMEFTNQYAKGKLVRSFASAPERDLGPFQFIVDIRFWGAIIVIGVLLWLLFAKVLLKDMA